MSKAAGTDPSDVQRPKISFLLNMFMKAGVVKSESDIKLVRFVHPPEKNAIVE
jgi:hypothetical protein